MYIDYFKNDSTAQNYIKTNDYYNLGNYIMKNSYVENRNDAAQLYREGRDLVKQGRIYNSLLEKGDDEQKQAVMFLNAINNGGELPKYIDTANGKIENKFTKNYIDQINKYFSKGDVARFVFQSKDVKRNPIPGLGVLTDWMLADAHYDTDGYEDFLKNIGMSDIDFQNYIKDTGGIVGIRNGVHYLELTNKDIRVLGRVSQALNKTKNIEGANRWGASMLKYATDDDGNKIVKNGQFVVDEHSASNLKDYNSEQTYIPNLENGANNEAKVYNRGNASANIMKGGTFGVGAMIYGVGYLLDEGIRYLNQKYTTIGGILDSAEEVQNKLYELNEINDTAFQIQRTGYKSAAHKRLEDAWQKGLIKSEQYNITKKQFDERYDLIVGTAPYTQYQIYSDLHNESGDRVLKELSLEDKSVIQEYISKAYGNNNTNSIKYEIGNYGDKGGMYITIPSGVLNNFKERVKYLTGLNKYENDQITLFVPNLAPKAQYDLLDSRTEIQASRELQSMQKYKYDYELSDGSKLSVDNSGHYVKTDQFGNVRTILSEEALTDMNREKIIEVGAEQMHNAAYTYNGDKYIDDDGNWNYDKNKIKQIVGWCNNSALELYPDLKYEPDENKRNKQIFLEAYKLYNQILNKLNIGNVDAEYFKKLYDELFNS